MFSSLLKRNSTKGSTDVNLSPSNEKIVGFGTFRKQGSGYKNWKVRKYIIRTNLMLSYYDPKSSCSDADLKGTLNLTSVRLVQGNINNIKSSGIAKTEIENAYALSLTCLENGRTIEIVFDSLAEIKHFLSLVDKISVVNNLPVRNENIDPKIFLCNNSDCFFFHLT